MSLEAIVEIPPPIFVNIAREGETCREIPMWIMPRNGKARELIISGFSPKVQGLTTEQAFRELKLALQSEV